MMTSSVLMTSLVINQNKKGTYTVKCLVLQLSLLSSVHISMYKSCVTVLQTVTGLAVYVCQYPVPLY